MLEVDSVELVSRTIIAFVLVVYLGLVVRRKNETFSPLLLKQKIGAP